MKKIYLILLGVLIGCPVLYAQMPDIYTKNAILDGVANQIKVLPQEKVYLHIDKGTCLPGDTLWFRGYLVDATFHLQLPTARFVYVELVNPLDSIVSQVVIRENKKRSYQGYLPVARDLPEGIYTLRSYTQYMVSNERDYLFKRPIHIVTPQWNNMKIKSVAGMGTKPSMTLSFSEQSQNVTVLDAKMSFGIKKNTPLKIIGKTNEILFNWDKAFQDGESSWLLSFKDDKNNSYQRFFPSGTTNEDYDVSFYPEGGYLLNGIPCRVAFKALGCSGNSMDISFDVLDEEGQVVAVGQTLHEGMGSFTFTPELNKKYRVSCSNAYSRKKVFTLPAVDNKVTNGLRVDVQKESFKVSLLSVNNAVPETLYLIAHVRGIVVYSGECKEPGKSYLFAKKDFPAGVVQFLLLDKSGKPLSERLAFSDNYTPSLCTVSLESSSMKKREPTMVNLHLTNAAQQPLKGNFSVAVTDNYYAPTDTCQSILSHLLLTSELKGTIKSPGFYFKHGSAATRICLDLLMMTQGWRRYSIPDIIYGNYAKSVKEKHSEFAISGRTVTLSPLLGKNSNEHLVSITGVGNAEGFQRMVPTDAEGYFCFDSIEYSDGSGFYLEAMQLKGKKTGKIELDTKETTKLTSLFPQPPLEDDSIKSVQTEELVGISKVGNMHYLLQDVVIKAPFWGSRNYQKVTERETIRYKNMKSMLKSMGMDILSVAQESEKTETLAGDSATNIEVKIDEGRVYETLYYGSQKVLVFVDDAYCALSDMVVSWLTPGDIEDISFIKDVKRDRANALLKGSLHWGEQMFTYGDLCSAYAKIPLKQETIAVLNVTTKKGFDSRCFGWWAHLYRDIQQNNQRKKTFYPLGYQLPVEFYSPKYDTADKKNSEVPDVRTTLYWQPELITDEQGNASFLFYNSDQVIGYSLIIEGISDQGELIHVVKQLK